MEEQVPRLTATTPSRSGRIPHSDSQIVLIDPSNSFDSEQQQQNVTTGYPMANSGGRTSNAPSSNGSSSPTHSSTKKGMRCGRYMFVSIIILMAMVMTFNLELENLLVRWEFIPQTVTNRGDSYNLSPLKKHKAHVKRGALRFNPDFSADPSADAMEASDVFSSSLKSLTDRLASPPKKAAEALICRASVVNFVINATDAKDECDGLKKAFEKTCSGDNDKSTKQRSRRLSRESPRPSNYWKQWSLELSYGWHAWLRLQTSQILYRVGGQGATDTLRTSGQARGRNGIENLERWNGKPCNPLVTEKCNEMRPRRHHQRLLVDDTALQPPIISPESASNVTTDPAPTNKTKIHLDLPIGASHVSDKVLSDTLMLQQGDQLLDKVNQTQAKADAAVSSKAVHDTSAVVEAVLNDPTSIEARTCCSSILNVYHENCSTDEEESVSDVRLFFGVAVMALCGMTKSLIRHFRILWLPEAAGCIIVGVLSGYVLMCFPHHDISFDGNWFLRIMVPPIIFEAAISIDKRSFNRHVIPILIYAIGGTLLATVLTAGVVQQGTALFSGWCTPIPFVEALTFGALISSIDPIAVLSVLNNMGMTDTDTIYVLIFGESLLNDGVAIVLFQTLVHFLDESLVIDSEAVTAAAIHFVVVALGSFLIGVASGILSTVYFWIFHGCQTPLVEVLMFFCWALLPYYVSDGIGWSGIVSVVAAGFVMDLYIIGDPVEDALLTDASEDSYMYSKDEIPRRRGKIFSALGQLSRESKTHIGFVTEIISTTMETAIFAYLGLFLFSSRYHWNVWHTLISIVACCLSRGIMIPTLSCVANWLVRLQQKRNACRRQPQSATGVVIDKKMQMVLWFAGLRGAMSFALVEHIPLYDEVSGEGTPLKAELKAMTSACIMFTVFVLGGRTYYMMDQLGLAPNSKKGPNRQILHEESFSLVNGKDHESESSMDTSHHTLSKSTQPGRAFRRPRLSASETTDKVLNI